MKPRQMMVATQKYWLKCPHPMTPQYITIHNTANDASANNEISYMRTNDTSTSFHFAIDDKEVVQGLPLNRNGWHAGDGNGQGNRNSIGIEICYSLSGGSRFTKAEKNAAKFTAQLLKERKWDISRVKKHQDWSGKYCPHRTLDMGWTRFLNMVQKELNPPKPAPKPTPQIKYATIPKKSIELIRNANLWDFNFTDWTKAKPVKGYKKGDKIDNIVAIATNALGAKYYVTEFSFKNKVTNGFNINDAKDYVPPVTPPKPPVEPPKPEPEPEPTPEPEPPVEPPKDYSKDNNALLKQLVELVKQVLEKLTSIFK